MPLWIWIPHELPGARRVAGYVHGVAGWSGTVPGCSSSLMDESGPRLQRLSTPSRSYHIWWIIPLDSVARTW